ncbi:MAG: UDP-N-acetylglucosamine--N-acetylmuramyl-(pentapeptide) pyrophosphoryl-undecaprenol N-acetylglucosamine transferase, partial [Elusimicrobiota bacterium]
VTIFVFGGSLGSRNINLSAIGILPYLEGLRKDIQFIHICGKHDLKTIAQRYESGGFKARVYDYLDKIEYAYSVADVVIARAGATTVSEITALGIPAILIPYPEATAQHQMLNAVPLCKIGGAICCTENILSGEGLALRIIPLIKDRNKRREMSISTTSLRDNFREAAERFADLVFRYIHKNV